MTPTILDQVVGYFAPERGLRRLRARAAAAALTRAYEGARVGRRTDGWIAAGTDADSEIATGLGRLRSRSRDLVRNNAYGALRSSSEAVAQTTSPVAALASNLTGTGIMPRARADAAEATQSADALWLGFAETCDADGHTDFYGLQTLIARTVVESGECLVRLVPRSAREGLAVPLQLQVLEPDHLDGSRDLPGGGFVHQGIEFDRLGRRSAYWLFPLHPGSHSLARRRS